MSPLSLFSCEASVRRLRGADKRLFAAGFADVPKGPEKMIFYRCDERKWYTAPSAGDPFSGSNSAKDYSPVWDQELGIVVRITQCGFADKVNVHVMRLDPATLKLTSVESMPSIPLRAFSGRKFPGFRIEDNIHLWLTDLDVANCLMGVSFARSNPWRTANPADIRQQGEKQGERELAEGRLSRL